MSADGGDPGIGGTVPPGRHTQRIVPFWVLQATEILSVVGLADLSLHVSRGGVLAVAGGVFAALALAADGPLGILRICGRKLHVILVSAVAVIVAVSPVVSALRPDIEGIIILEVATIGIIRLATLVSTDPRPVSPKGVGGSGTVINARARVAPPSAPERPGRTASPSTGRSRFPTEEGVGSAARWAGRAAGAATSAAARSTAKHGPTAKAQVKRTIRSAGRLVGKAASRPDGPPSKPG